MERHLDHFWKYPVEKWECHQQLGLFHMNSYHKNNDEKTRIKMRLNFLFTCMSTIRYPIMTHVIVVVCSDKVAKFFLYHIINQRRTLPFSIKIYVYKTYLYQTYTNICPPIQSSENWIYLGLNYGQNYGKKFNGKMSDLEVILNIALDEVMVRDGYNLRIKSEMETSLKNV